MPDACARNGNEGGNEWMLDLITRPGDRVAEVARLEEPRGTRTVLAVVVHRGAEPWTHAYAVRRREGRPGASVHLLRVWPDDRYDAACAWTRTLADGGAAVPA
ncbi:MAG TPA: hypothetical protein VEB20_26070 [Azospirillaceae bacterium]|nr:hypothetical protein [Azospirillaceae bacterium]